MKFKMDEVETLKLVIAILSVILTASEIFFPFFSPYQGFLDAIVVSLKQKEKEAEKKVTINENKNIVVPSSFTTTESGSKSE